MHINRSVKFKLVLFKGQLHFVWLPLRLSLYFLSSLNSICLGIYLCVYMCCYLTLLGVFWTLWIYGLVFVINLEKNYLTSFKYFFSIFSLFSWDSNQPFVRQLIIVPQLLDDLLALSLCLTLSLNFFFSLPIFQFWLFL